MKLAAMRYKDYVWPHNPRVYTIRYERSMGERKVPFGRYVLQDLGPAKRVMRGEGEFVGEGAYQEFKKLASVFYEDGPGLLVHPVWQTERAYFTSLEAAEEPLPDFVRYRFEFWEDCGGYDGGLKAAPSGGGEAGNEAGTPPSPRTHTVRKGDTLWGIARQYGAELAALIRANPQIKNPNLIYPGEAVKLP